MKQSILEVIKSRHSVRTYSNNPIDESILEKIQTYIDSVTNPFNKKIQIKLLKPDGYHNEKLGTYGVINPLHSKRLVILLKKLSYIVLHLDLVQFGLVELLIKGNLQKLLNLKMGMFYRLYHLLGMKAAEEVQ